MIAEAQVTTRNAGLLVIQRGAQVASGFLFAMLIPRLMGPETYGQYALITSLALWFMLASTLGFTQVIARYIPQFALSDDTPGMRTFFGNLMTVRLASGVLAAGLYLLLAVLWLHDLDRLSLALLAGVIIVRAAAHLFFALFLGFNQAARWGMEPVLRGCLSLLLLPIGFIAYGLPGACLALLLTEVVMLFTGTRWAIPLLSWPRLQWSMSGMAPYLRFGLFFFGSDLLLTAFQRSGETMVRILSEDYKRVGFFALAYSVYLTVAVALPQLTMSFAPLFTSLRTRGQIVELQQWVERLLKWLAVGGMLAVFGVLLLAGNLVLPVLGAAYQPVAANLLPLMLTIVVLALSSVARLLALVYDQPGVALAAEGVRLVAFWTLGPLLVARQGDFGGCVAVLLASTLYAAYYTWRMMRIVPYSLRMWALVIALGGLFLPLTWLPSILGASSLALSIGLYGTFLMGYGGILFLLRIITPAEIAAAWQAISHRVQPTG